MGRNLHMMASKSNSAEALVRVDCYVLGMDANRGVTELFYDRGHHHEFLSLSQELAAPGEMRQAQTFDFSFKNVEKQYESYQGINVKLRCVLCTCSQVPTRLRPGL